MRSQAARAAGRFSSSRRCSQSACQEEEVRRRLLESRIEVTDRALAAARSLACQPRRAPARGEVLGVGGGGLLEGLDRCSCVPLELAQCPLEGEHPRVRGSEPGGFRQELLRLREVLRPHRRDRPVRPAERLARRDPAHRLETRPRLRGIPLFERRQAQVLFRLQARDVGRRRTLRRGNERENEKLSQRNAKTVGTPSADDSERRASARVTSALRPLSRRRPARGRRRGRRRFARGSGLERRSGAPPRPRSRPRDRAGIRRCPSNGGQRHGLRADLLRASERRSDRGGEELFLSLLTAAPDRPHGMDHPPRRQRACRPSRPLRRPGNARSDRTRAGSSPRPFAGSPRRHPAPSCRCSLAALTIASTVSSVMSP